MRISDPFRKNMKLIQSIALPEQAGDVRHNTELLYKPKTSFTMQETGRCLNRNILFWMRKHM